MKTGAHDLTMGIISALVAGNIEAVSEMLVALAAIDANQADSVMQAFVRGNEARADVEVGAHRD